MPPSGFPLNIVDVMVTRLSTIEGLKSEVIKRPLRLSDPAICVGVHAADWTPVAESKQIGQLEPAVGIHVVRVQNMVKHSNEVEGRALYTYISKLVRVMLYRDTTLISQISGLSEDLLGTRERVQKFGIRQQRYLNNEFRGAMVYLGSTDFFIETEMVTF